MNIKSFVRNSIEALETAMNKFIRDKKVLGVQYQIKQNSGDHCTLILYEE